MKLGAFSISLAVKDLKASRDFYMKLGFEEAGGDMDQNWLILRQDTIVLGLFQGMFERNMLTFNPGWDQMAAPLEAFDDVRAIQAALLAAGLSLDKEADADGSGPDSVVLTDPDGNPVLIDQHV